MLTFLLTVDVIRGTYFSGVLRFRGIVAVWDLVEGEIIEEIVSGSLRDLAIDFVAEISIGLSEASSSMLQVDVNIFDVIC